MSTETRTNITGIGTIGIPVNDQDRALEFYVGKLGFDAGMDATYGAGQRWVEVAPTGSPTAIALVQANEGYPAGIDTGIRLGTDDAAADHTALRARGVDVDPEIIPFPVPMFTFRDTDGNRLVIVQRPSGR